MAPLQGEERHCESCGGKVVFLKVEGELEWYDIPNRGQGGFITGVHRCHRRDAFHPVRLSYFQLFEALVPSYTAPLMPWNLETMRRPV